MTVVETLERYDWRRAADPDPTAAVAQVPLFAKLGRRQARELARGAELAAFVPGDVVLSEGAPADFFYVVLRGEADLREARGTRRLRPGDYFGETRLLDETSRSVTVVATDELRVLRLPGSLFLRLLRQSPSVAFAVLKHVGGSVQRQDRRLTRRAA
jgi:CRP-like cAMP-binding protein